MGMVAPAIPRASRQARAQWLAWLPIIAGLMVLYLPSFLDLFRTIWATDEQAHGPIVLSIACWLAWRNWPEMWLASRRPADQYPWGWPIVVVALLLYASGARRTSFSSRSAPSFGCWSAILLLTRGTTALKAQWFALFFMLFMIPLPGVLVDAVTMPMKMAVSFVAEHILYSVGYPIARTGVILQIGQYKLLVADACAGLHTLFTLEALGLLYLNIVRTTHCCATSRWPS
jgi:exosortase B